MISLVFFEKELDGGIFKFKMLGIIVEFVI